MDKINWGIISTANIAVKQVIPAIKRSGNGDVFAISSSSGREKEVAKNFSIPRAYDSHEKLLADTELDAVYIPLPNSLHAEWCVRAANAGKHILCEKPVALNPEQFNEIEQACKENNVYFMEGFMYRFHPQHEKVKELIVANKIGKPITIQSSFHFTVTDPENDIRMDPVLGGGVTYDIGCYSVNLINYLLDQKPRKVFASANYKKVDTKITAIMEYQDDVTGVIDSSFHGPMTQKYSIIGTRGTIDVPFAFRPDLNGDMGEVILNNRNGKEIFRMKEAQYVKEVEHFSETVLNGGKLLYQPLHAYENIQTIDALLKSAKAKKVITI